MWGFLFRERKNVLYDYDMKDGIRYCKIMIGRYYGNKQNYNNSCDS